MAGRFSVRAGRGVNHVRFTGRLGRRILPRGTYRITARTKGRPPSRPIAVVVGNTRARGTFDCGSTPAEDGFAAIVGTFANGDDGNGAANSGSASGSARADVTPKKHDSGVLPAVSQRLRELPDALPRPQLAASGSPSWILGVGALLLLVLSGVALVVYVVRFMRRPVT